MARAKKGTDLDAATGLDLKCTRTCIYCVLFCQANGLVHPPVKDQVHIYTPEWREAIVCKFLAQGNYVCTRMQTYDLNVPDVTILQMQLSNQASYRRHTYTHTHTHTHTRTHMHTHTHTHTQACMQTSRNTHTHT